MLGFFSFEIVDGKDYLIYQKSACSAGQIH